MAFRVRIGQDSFKAFKTNLELLAKFGDELHFEAKRDQLILWTINTTASAQAIVRLSPRLFQQYKIRRINNESMCCCRVLIKTLRKMVRHNQNSPNISHVELQMMAGNTDNNASPEHRLSVVFVFQSGLTKKHSLWYQDDEEAPTMFSKSAMPHLLAFDPGLLQDNLALVHPQIQYITLAFSANNIYLKTYWDDSIVRPGGKPLQSNFKFSRSDFITCNVSRDDLQITVGLKELKAVLSYALETGSVLYARFDDAGGPIIFTVEEHGLVLTDIAVMSQMAEEHISQVSDSHSNNGSITSMENSFMSRLSVNQRQRPAPVAEESSPAVAPEPTTQHRRSAQPSASSGRRTQHKRPPPTSGRPSSSSSRSSRAHGPPEPAAPTPETSSLHSPSWSRVASGHDPVSDVPSDQLVSLSSSSSDHYRRIPTRPISPTQLQQDSRDDGSTTEDEDEQLFTVEPKKRRFFDSN